MNINLSQYAAFGRHVITAVAAVAGTLAALHVISAGDATSISTAISQIGDGIAKVTAGVTTLVAIGSGIWASYTASTKSQVAAVQTAAPQALVNAVQQVAPVVLRDAVAAQPEVKAVVMTSAQLAAASPSPKVTT